MQLDVTGKRLRLDPRDPGFYQDPYPVYRRLQDECPVVYWEDFARWCFVRHRDVSTILRDRRFGRSTAHVEGLESRPPILDVDRFSMLDLEPPSHTRLRRLVQGAFIAREIEGLRPRIAALTHRLVDDMEERVRREGRVDLLPTFATPIPVTVIAELLGVPVEMSQSLLDWSHTMVQVYQLGPTDEQIRAARAASGEFVDFLRGYVERRRKEPKDDLLTQLIAAEEDGDRLTEDELISTCILLLNAGHEATVHVLGNGTLALLRHPEQLAWWRADLHGRARTAVEELLRFDTPLHLFNRWALEDVEVAGLELEKGTEVSLLLGAANVDPEAFTDPLRLDLSRPKNPHVSFGLGLHYCLGAPLARLELQIALPILLERLPGLALDESVDEPRYADTYHFHGLESLWVRC